VHSNVETHLWPSVPAALLLAAAAVEAAYRVRRRRTPSPEPSPAWRILLWSVRPWEIWAAFNLLFRWRKSLQFNVPETFPFYANLWDGTGGHILARSAHLFGQPAFRLWLVVALALLASLNGVLVFLLARRVFGSAETAWGTVLLWAAAPATATYGTFAMEPFFALFFHAALLLAWLVGTSVLRGWRWTGPALLGLCVGALALLTYIWCIVAAIAGAFAFAAAGMRRWPWTEPFRRLGLAAIVCLTALAAFLLHFHLDYAAVYARSSAFVSHCYRGGNAGQWVMGLVGGQLAQLLMMGPIAATAFCSSLRRLAWREWLDDRSLLLVLTLGLYLVPVLAVNALKVEAPRQWGWVTTLPLAWAAHRLLSLPRGRLLLAVAVAVSGLVAILLRCTMEILA
jgi:hypothetical protein